MLSNVEASGHKGLFGQRKCDWSELPHALSIKHTSDYEDLVLKSERKTSSLILITPLTEAYRLESIKLISSQSYKVAARNLT